MQQLGRGLWSSLREVDAQSGGNPDDAIAVLGITGRFPRAASVEALWERLRASEDCVVPVPEDRWSRARTQRLASGCRWGGFIDDFDRFDPAFFEFESLAAECTDPQERQLLEVVWQLLERAGYPRRRLLETCSSAVGCYVGASNNDYSHLRAPSSWWVESLLTTLNHGAIANRVAHFFDLRGPSLAVDTFCSSSAMAVHLACQALRSGDCKLAIAAGVNLIMHPDRYEILRLTRHLASRESSRSFADGDGYIPAEAVSAVLLKPLATAVRDSDNIIGVIRATAANHGGRAAAFGVANPDQQAEVIERCLRNAQCSPAGVGYIEASASGAALGDPLELSALRRVFGKQSAGKRSWPIGSVKSNLGHAEGASGMTQLAKVLLQLQHGQLIPSIRAEPANPRLSWAELPFHLVRELQEWQPTPQLPRRALLNSFGAGGTNVTLLLEEYIPARAGEAGSMRPVCGGGAQVVILSARNRLQLRAHIEQMLQLAVSSPELDVEDLAYTLQIGREAMKCRVAVVARDLQEVVSGWQACLREELPSSGRVQAEVAVFVGEIAGGNLFSAAATAPDERGAQASRHSPADLALGWTQGKPIAWSSLWRTPRRILVLPTYPFTKERCWAAVLTHDHPELQGGASGLEADASNAHNTPRPQLSRDRAAYVAPRNPLEQSLAQIWEEVMGRRPIGIQESFFDVGGDSMLAVLVINRCQEAFGVRVDVSALLGREGTIERLAVATVAALVAEQAADDIAVDAMIDEVTQERMQ